MLVALIAWAWLSTARDGRPRYLIILLSWIWVPLHGMWPIGLVISSVMAAAVLIDRRPARAEAVKILAVPVLSGVLSLATPLGWRAVAGVVTVGERKQYFTEWRPPVFTELGTIGVTIMVACVLVHLLRNGPASWTTVALLGLAIGCALLSMRTIPIAAVLIAPLFAQAAQALVPRSGATSSR